MPAIRIYSISENGEFLGEGTIGELEVWLNLSKKEIRKAVREGKPIGKYDVAFLREDRKSETEKGKIHLGNKRKEDRKEKEDDLLNDHLAFLKYHLSVYGNTSVNFDPFGYLPDLYEQGLNCRAKTITEPAMQKVKGRRSKPKVHYYVEVVKNETEGQRTGV